MNLESTYSNNLNQFDSYGLKKGLWRTFYDNGKTRGEVNYVRGNKHGLYREWYEDGRISREINFVFNRMKMMKIYNSEGCPIIVSYYESNKTPTIEGEMIEYGY